MPDPQSPPPRFDPLRWLTLAFATFFVLGYPWLAPITQGRSLGGVPLILVYLGVAWAAIILAAARLRPFD